MASSEIDTREAGGAADTGVDPGAQAGDSPAPAEERPARRFRGSGVSAADRERILKELRRIEFPAALRGYDRSAVDRYVEEVNRLIAELEISASPESAVRHALDEVSEETRGLLQRAHQTAEEIISRARGKAGEQLGQAQAEAQEVRETAQREASELREMASREAAAAREAAASESARLHAAAQREADELREGARHEVAEMLEAAEDRRRELAHSAETIWRERRRLIEDVRTVGDQLVAIGDTEAKRFTQVPGEGGTPPEAGAEAEPDLT